MKNKLRMGLFLLVSLFTFSPSLPAHATSEAALSNFASYSRNSSDCWVFCYEKPEERLTHFGTSSRSELDPDRIQILVWNIYKAQKELWQSDFQNLRAGKDLVLLQETFLNTEFRDEISEQHYWAHASGFVTEGVETGVGTGSSVEPLWSDYRVSEDREPIAKTPKMTALTRYALTGTDLSLLVINIHVVNFRTSTQALRKQLNAVQEVIENHSGPILFAGDFNTWSVARREALELFMESQSFSKVKFEADPRKGLKLDHFFVKDLKVQTAEIPDWVEGSDHLPLSVEVSVL